MNSLMIFALWVLCVGCNMHKSQVLKYACGVNLSYLHAQKVVFWGNKLLASNGPSTTTKYKYSKMIRQYNIINLK